VLRTEGFVIRGTTLFPGDQTRLFKRCNGLPGPA